MSVVLEEEDWNVDDCRGDHESDEHWELRRTFLLKHKGSYDRMKLMCLAQVFVNVEFLGCRYPQETMEQVNELSQGVIEEYRENKKGRLKRTFVKASEAAEKKTKGSKRRSNANEPPEVANKVVVIDDPSISGVKVSPKIAFSSSVAVFSQNASAKESIIHPKDTNSVNLGLFGGMNDCKEYQDHRNISEQLGLELECNVQLHDGTETDEKNVVVPKYGSLTPEAEAKLKELVIFRTKQDNESPISVLQNSCTKWQAVNPVYKVDEIENELFSCSVSIVSETIAECTGRYQKLVKHDVTSKALKILQQYCHTIEVKKPFHSEAEYERKDVDKFGLQSNQLATENFNSTPLAEENRGIKLLKSMGWSGGGLGKNGEGIEKPIETPSVVDTSRAGIGLPNATNVSDVGFKDKFKKFLEANMWRCFENDHDLQFSNEFDNNERKIMHQIASSLGLATKSYGKEDERYLVVSQKWPKLYHLTQKVIQDGCENEKYKVYLPGCWSSGSGSMSINESSDDDS